jgi:hypothetical protein
LTRLPGLRPESVVVLVYELLVGWIQASGEVHQGLTIETLILLSLFFRVSDGMIYLRLMFGCKLNVGIKKIL